MLNSVLLIWGFSWFRFSSLALSSWNHFLGWILLLEPFCNKMMESRKIFDSRAEHAWENTVLPTAPTWTWEEGHRAAQLPLQTITHSYCGKGLASPQAPAQASGPAGETSWIILAPQPLLSQHRTRWGRRESLWFQLVSATVQSSTCANFFLRCLAFHTWVASIQRASAASERALLPLGGGCAAAGAVKASASPRSCSVTWFPAWRLWTALP